MPVRVLIVDNRDSFTFNLAQLAAKVTATEPVVIDNTESRWAAIAHERGVGAIILSPGPGTPRRPSDLGICREVVLQSALPLLGVCLGCQGIGYAYGASITAAPQPMHGRLSRVRHRGGPLFEGIPESFRAVRYHSLCLDSASVPPCLRITASTGDGVPMALSHRSRPQHGVQFHPESICAQFGERLLRNFMRLASECTPSGQGPAATRHGHATVRRGPAPGRGQRVIARKLAHWIEPADAFDRLYSGRDHAFWLDSSSVKRGVSRFSVMGGARGPGSAVLRYTTRDRTLSTRRGGAWRTAHVGSLLPVLRSYLDRQVALEGALPFDFRTGLVGYLGYEMRNEFGAPTARESLAPDAAFIDSDRCVVFDHLDRCIFLLARATTPARGAERWLQEMANQLGEIRPSAGPCPPAGGLVVACPSDGPVQHARKVRACQEELSLGESYQVCLTSDIPVTCSVDPYTAYRELRSRNPAPHAAYLRFGDVALLSSSPERFLQVTRDRTISAKPIKGTCARGAGRREDARLAERLRTGEKFRSENLTIVDLLRNDIGRIAEPASVRVPKLMDVESYATVHQLVSTVTGRLPADRDCLDCLAAAFPGGSMTGAPKLRTLSIIDRLEARARGPYAGAIGFLSLGDTMDLSIVIRTIVMAGSRITLASGGGIVAMSDPEQEFEELLLKAEAPLRALAAASSGDPEAWELRYATP